jgi:hypothetical protein
MKKETVHVRCNILQLVLQYIHTSNPNTATNSKEIYVGISPDIKAILFFNRLSVPFSNNLQEERIRNLMFTFLSTI